MNSHEANQLRKLLRNCQRNQITREERIFFLIVVPWRVPWHWSIFQLSIHHSLYFDVILYINPLSVISFYFQDTSQEHHTDYHRLEATRFYLHKLGDLFLSL